MPKKRSERKEMLRKMGNVINTNYFQIKVENIISRNNNNGLGCGNEIVYMFLFVSFLCVCLIKDVALCDAIGMKKGERTGNLKIFFFVTIRLYPLFKKKIQE